MVAVGGVINPFLGVGVVAGPLVDLGTGVGCGIVNLEALVAVLVGDRVHSRPGGGHCQICAAQLLGTAVSYRHEMGR